MTLTTNAFNLTEMLFGIWKWGCPLWWIIKPSPTEVIVLSAGTLDNNKNLWLCVWACGGEAEMEGGRWNNRNVRSLYCTQNNSAPQDSWGNNVPCHCVCNYTGERQQSDWLVCQSSPSSFPYAHSSTYPPFFTHTSASTLLLLVLPTWTSWVLM